MSRILTAFAREESREAVNTMLERCGMPPYVSFRSGAEIIRAVHKLGGGVVICGYRLLDMTVNELAENLSGQATLLVIAKAALLSGVEAENVRALPAPLTRAQLAETVEECMQRENARVRACVPQRSPEEIAVIARAKQRLMDEGWTETQAHALLQKKSMISRRSMADVARELLEEA